MSATNTAPETANKETRMSFAEAMKEGFVEKTVSKKDEAPAPPPVDRIVTDRLVQITENAKISLGGVEVKGDLIPDALRLHAKSVIMGKFGMKMLLNGKSLGKLEVKSDSADMTYQILPKLPNPGFGENLMAYYDRIKATLSFEYVKYFDKVIPYIPQFDKAEVSQLSKEIIEIVDTAFVEEEEN